MHRIPRNTAPSGSIGDNGDNGNNGDNDASRTPLRLRSRTPDPQATLPITPSSTPPRLPASRQRSTADNRIFQQTFASSGSASQDTPEADEAQDAEGSTSVAMQLAPQTSLVTPEPSPAKKKTADKSGAAAELEEDPSLDLQQVAQPGPSGSAPIKTSLSSTSLAQRASTPQEKSLGQKYLQAMEEALFFSRPTTDADVHAFLNPTAADDSATDESEVDEADLDELIAFFSDPFSLNKKDSPTSQESESPKLKAQQSPSLMEAGLRKQLQDMRGEKG